MGNPAGYHRNAIVDALNKTVEIFTSHSGKSFDEVVSCGLQPVADAAGLNRIAVYRLLEKESGRMGQIYVWAYGSAVPLDEELVDLPKTPPVIRWLERLTKGECIHGNTKDMLKDEEEFLTSFGVKTILLVPVFTRGEFWGVISLEDHTNYRYFDEDCMDLLHSAARMCANVFIRNEMMQSLEKSIKELERREKYTKALNNAAIMFLSQTGETFEKIMTSGVRQIVDMLNVDRLSVWRNSRKTDGRHISQIYRWHREEGGTTDLTKEFQDVTYSSLVPRWEEILSKNESINSPVNLLPEVKLLKSYGMVSAFVTPVFIYNDFWGFVIFEDLKNERYFDEESIEMMRSASLLCASTVMRADMERDIADTNEFNRATIDNLPVGFVVVDDNLRFLDCNNTILKILGTTKQYFLKNFNEFLPEYQRNGEKSRESKNEILKQVFLSDKRFVFEWEHVSSSGENIPFEITLMRTAYKGKNILLAFQYDLRNIKEMENAVTEAEKLTHIITEANPIPYVLFDEDFNPIDCNNAAIQIFGSPDKKFVLENYWKEFLPEKQPDGKLSADKAKLKWEETLKNKQNKFEWIHRSMDGEMIPMENTATHFIYKGREFVVSYKYDLRNTKKMLKNIREQSELIKVRLEQQELISEISRGFISSGDSETYIKEAIARLGHYHNVSQTMIFRIDYNKKTANLAYYWSINDSKFHQAKVDLFELINDSFPERLPDCSTLPVICCEDVSKSTVSTYHPLLNINVNAFIIAPLYVEGRLWGYFSVEQCNTSRRWTDNEKYFVAMTAGTIAGVIMRNIYNTMLKDALEKATIASKAKGEFLSNMSHEMRTPLNAIIGMTAIAKNAADLERKNNALNKIEDASTHLLGVINDVLDMSKIEANKFELSIVEFNFEKMLQKTVAVINFRVEEKHQKISVYIDKNIPEFLVGDDQRLTQIITNLLGNAVKFTPENGSINLDARFIKEENNLCTVQVSVSDTGIGMSEEQISRLFQSFQQAETSTVRKYGGTGLGLAISKNIVEMMGGRIWVESETNKGSVFTFTILAKRGKGKRMSLRERAKNWDNIRILAVDDDQDILEFFKDISKRYGVCCDTAVNGDEALRLIERNGNYNVYFIDWKMPGMDGITLSSSIKSMGNKPDNSVVILISAAEWSGIEEKAKKAGVERFLSKPLFPSSIADTICECLGVERQVKDKEQITGIDSFAGHRILLAEDVEINREIVLTIMDPLELEIDCAENGLNAVKMFCENPEKYELIFMDVQMPEMDGYGATRKIRAFEEEQRKAGKLHKRIPIIAMTANVFKEDIEKCLKAGMDDHISKPLDFEIVMEKLRIFLK